MFSNLKKTCSAIWRKCVRRFGENVFNDLEKTSSAFWRKHVRRFGENVFGDLEKTCLTKTLEIWRNVVSDLENRVRRHSLAIPYWSSLWSSSELGDRKWRSNHNGEIMEKNYGDKNFIHQEVESTYLERFKDRNV